MIVPKYWAEARVQHKKSGKQITVRRFGWSNTSMSEAQQMADIRAQVAYEQIASGTILPRRDTKVAYGGGDGCPIREEIIASHGDTVISRNSYGAHCLNTPNVLFADIDLKSRLSSEFSCSIRLLLMIVAVLFGMRNNSLLIGLAAFASALILGQLFSYSCRLLTSDLPWQIEKRARANISKFVRDHMDWHLRLYRTPAGFRVLVLHKTFDPQDPAVADFFAAIGTDPLYAHMCKYQKCFRARVSPKPWRIGITKHMRPRPGVWPLAPEWLPVRARWIADYEKRGRDYAACRFVETLGSSTVTSTTEAVRALHDELSGALTSRPLA